MAIPIPPWTRDPGINLSPAKGPSASTRLPHYEDATEQRQPTVDNQVSRRENGAVGSRRAGGIIVGVEKTSRGLCLDT